MSCHFCVCRIQYSVGFVYMCVWYMFPIFCVISICSFLEQNVVDAIHTFFPRRVPTVGVSIKRTHTHGLPHNPWGHYASRVAEKPPGEAPLVLPTNMP